MLEYVVGAAMRLPVVLQTSAGVPVTGITVASVTCSFVKSNGVSYDVALTGGNWSELAGAAYTGAGYYNIIAPVTYSSDAGILQYCARVSGANTYFGVVKVVSGDTNAIYNTIAAGGLGGGGSSAVLVSQPGSTVVPARNVGSAIRVPVVLYNTGSGLPVVGVLSTAVTATIQKNDGTLWSLTVTADNWAQANTSSFSSLGFYTLIIDGQYTNQAGYLAYAVTVSGSRPYFDVVSIGYSQDIAKVLGKPIQTIANDVIEVGKRVQRIDGKIR